MVQNKAEGKTEATQKTKTVLVVEDNNMIGDLLVTGISFMSRYHVIWVTTAAQALEAVSHIIPHLFLIDYHLPDMNGIALYDQLHATEELKTVPAIFLSAALPVDELARRRVQGMEKPVQLRELIAMMQALVV